MFLLVPNLLNYLLTRGIFPLYLKKKNIFHAALILQFQIVEIFLCREIKMQKYFTFIFLFLFLLRNTANAETIEEFLLKFHNNPSLIMDRLPSTLEEGNITPRGFIFENEKLLKEKIQYSNQIRKKLMPAFSTAEENSDKPERIIEPSMVLKNIIDMDKNGLINIELPTSPWSDSYWPIHKGLIGIRYSDLNFPNTKDWITNYNYFLNYPTSNIINSRKINNLSPAEKYDYIMGDYNFTLTKYSWRQGEYYQKKYGMVPKWVGICHGWAAAAHMLIPYPNKSQIVKAVNGTSVTLYPQDVKALQSMLWANAPPAARFAGKRCTITNPMKSKNGRIIDSSCFDVNPATWHIAIVNQMGIHKRSFVIDSTYDLQVWNFPLYSFNYRYFNPQTLSVSTNPYTAIIPIEKFKVDKFSEFRSKDTKYIIGIYMDTTYVKEIQPSQQLNRKNVTKTVRYVYDLELDENKNIIGGEWYSNAHPDFIWTFYSEAQAKAKEDENLINNSWKKDAPIPSSWTTYAKSASARGIPLYSFITQLIDEQN